MPAVEKPDPVAEAQRERLLEVRKQLFKGNNAAFAEAAGLGASTLYKVLAGNTYTVSEYILESVIDNVEVEGQRISREWLEEGKGEMLAPAAGDGAREPQAARYDAETPASLEGEAGDVKRWRFSKYQWRGDAGDGATSDHVAGLPPEEAGGVVEIVRGREEVKVASGYDADELKPLFVAGNSMEPKIRANTPALYVPMDDVEASGIYYLKIDGRRIIKTVNVLAGGALKITSYNTEEYPEEETLLPAEDDQAGRYKSALTGLPVDFGVIGRLVMYTCVT